MRRNSLVRLLMLINKMQKHGVNFEYCSTDTLPSTFRAYYDLKDYTDYIQYISPDATYVKHASGYCGITSGGTCVMAYNINNGMIQLNRCLTDLRYLDKNNQDIEKVIFKQELMGDKIISCRGIKVETVLSHIYQDYLLGKWINQTNSEVYSAYHKIMMKMTIKDSGRV